MFSISYAYVRTRLLYKMFVVSISQPNDLYTNFSIFVFLCYFPSNYLSFPRPSRDHYGRLCWVLGPLLLSPFLSISKSRDIYIVYIGSGGIRYWPDIPP